MHHIGSSLLPSGLMNTLDPNSPPMTKVTRFIVFFLDMRIYFLVSSFYLTCIVLHVIFALDINCMHNRSITW
jgi:Ca2+/Na+ antiporter